MNRDTGYLLQAYIDNQLSTKERQLVESMLETDQQSLVLYRQLEQRAQLSKEAFSLLDTKQEEAASAFSAATISYIKGANSELAQTNTTNRPVSYLLPIAASVLLLVISLRLTQQDAPNTNLGVAETEVYIKESLNLDFYVDNSSSVNYQEEVSDYIKNVDFNQTARTQSTPQ